MKSFPKAEGVSLGCPLIHCSPCLQFQPASSVSPTSHLGIKSWGEISSLLFCWLLPL